MQTVKLSRVLVEAVTEFDVSALKSHIEALLQLFLDGFRDRCGYESGENILVEADSRENATVLVAIFGEGDLRADLLEFFSHFSRLVLPDVENGYFIGPPSWIVSIWGASEPRCIQDSGGLRELIAIGSDGGGGLFVTLRGDHSPVYLLPPSRIRDGVYIPMGGATLAALQIAPSFHEFLSEVVSRLRQATVA